ncbi:MAG: ferric reductase-like transmembrane domain-containing protein [Bryobacterales bacterium]|nr:ferric reductase-like transmembrane domain-containing protein [Bryobacterales bacterium]
MTTPYRAIQWTKQKAYFDLALLCAVFLYLTLFTAISLARIARPDYPEIGAVVSRALATLALLLLHFVLAIGPLSRINPAFVVLIPHRRHLGVVMFLVAMAHAGLSTVLRHTGGVLNPLASIVLGNGQIVSPGEWPFEVFGLAALIILAAQAATSHDFWIAYLSPEGWKRLQMLGYVAYALILVHAVLGVVRESRNPLFAILLIVGMVVLLLLHRKAAALEWARDRETGIPDSEGYIPVCPPEHIPLGRARIVRVGNERVAVFRYWQGISAVSNVCPHQCGPLGEGGMVAGCVRCPWHGAIFFPQNGLAPPPNDQCVPTFPVKLVDGCIYVGPAPFPLGYESHPLPVPGQKGRAASVAGQIQSERGVVSSQRKPAGLESPAETAGEEI